MGKIIFFSGWYTPELCAEHPKKLFVFGDNLKRFGMGGQAVIRRCPNAYGVATKRLPSMDERAFFSDMPDKKRNRDLEAVLIDIEELWMECAGSADIVIPVTKDGEISLGRERAELPERAPNIYNTIVMHIREMANVYGSIEMESL